MCSTQLVLVSPQQDEAVEIAAVHFEDRELDVVHFAALLEAREVGHGVVITMRSGRLHDQRFW